MAKKQEATNAPATLEEALKVIAEKDALIQSLENALDESNSEIAKAEQKIADLASAVSEKAALVIGVESFNLNGKSVTPKLPAAKSAGVVVFFNKASESKFTYLPADKKKYFGSLSDEEKESFIQSYPHLFTIQ